MAVLRVVLDTNVLVSGLAYPKSQPGRILGLVRSAKLQMILSQYILDETARVLPRLSRAQLSASEVRDVVDGLAFLSDIVTPSEQQEPLLRDLADQQVLGTLTASLADWLITGDKDLLVLADKYPILTVAEFWARYSSADGGCAG